MAIQDSFKKRIPAELFSHLLFLVHTAPVGKFYYRNEEALAKLLPCNTDGDPLRGHDPFPVCFTWLDKGLKVPQDAEPQDRRRQLFEYLLERASHVRCDHRLEVSRDFLVGRAYQSFCGAGVSAATKTAGRRWPRKYERCSP